MPEGDLLSYFFALTSLPFTEKVAAAYFFSDAEIVFAFAPGKFKLTLSITWLIKPDFMISIDIL